MTGARSSGGGMVMMCGSGGGKEDGCAQGRDGNGSCRKGFAPVNLVKWISSCKNVTETQVRFPEKPHSLLQRVAARNVVS